MEPREVGFKQFDNRLEGRNDDTQDRERKPIFCDSNLILL
jgi:hypothetical protein